MQLQIFQYQEEDHMEDLTTIEINGEVWFVASDVCNMLGIGNTTNAIKTLDDDEKLPFTIERAGQKRYVSLISESGLYTLIFKSTKESAKKFRKWVTKEVIPAIRKTGSYGINRLETPNFVVRFNDNWDRTERGYFSVISELYIRLYGKLEQLGYSIPNRTAEGTEIRPDVSVGRHFAEYLRKHHPEFANDYKMYNHKFPNGMEVEARQYKNDLLPLFIKFVDEHWIFNNAESYFRDRDIKALDYLPKLLSN